MVVKYKYNYCFSNINIIIGCQITGTTRTLLLSHVLSQVLFVTVKHWWISSKFVCKKLSNCQANNCGVKTADSNGCIFLQKQYSSLTATIDRIISLNLIAYLLFFCCNTFLLSNKCLTPIMPWWANALTQ